jgi:hypothetical protein
VFRKLFPILMETPDDGGSGGGDPAAPAAPAAPPAAPAGDAPWSADLAGLGLDDTARQAVDGYLRAQWQPRMTQFEQQLSEAAPARELWQDFHANPQETYLAVGAQLFGDEKASELEALIAAAEAADEGDDAPSAPSDPRVQAMLEDYEARQRSDAYSAKLAEVKAAHTDLDEELFHPFVIAADGDFGQAVARYRAYVEQFKAKHGVSPEVPQVPDAPATLGLSGGDGPAVPPPTTERYDSLDAALDATLAEMRTGSAPAVGTV